jgi:hypothetical protein
VLRALLAIAALGVAATTTDCADNDCSGDKCHPVTDVLDACLTGHTCTINKVSTTCDNFSECYPFDLSPNAVLRIPLDWSAIGTSSTGLIIQAFQGSATFDQPTVLFDDAPAEGCTFTTNTIQCPAVPISVQIISFSYTGGQASNLDVTMTDFACFAAYPPCEG